MFKHHFIIFLASLKIGLKYQDGTERENIFHFGFYFWLFFWKKKWLIAFGLHCFLEESKRIRKDRNMEGWVCVKHGKIERPHYSRMIIDNNRSTVGKMQTWIIWIQVKRVAWCVDAEMRTPIVLLVQDCVQFVSMHGLPLYHSCKGTKKHNRSDLKELNSTVYNIKGTKQRSLDDHKGNWKTKSRWLQRELYITV